MEGAAMDSFHTMNCFMIQEFVIRPWYLSPVLRYLRRREARFPISVKLRIVTVRIPLDWKLFPFYY